MKPRAFRYHRPTDVAEALALLGEHADDAKVLAGGQSLVPMLNFRLASPAHLVDVNAVGELAGFEFDRDGVRIGATVRQRAVELAADVAVSYPCLHRALRQVAHPQIRNRGTVCGSLAHADAAAELPAVMVALGAEMLLSSQAGSRLVGADSFFRFHLATALEPDELLTEVRLPPLAAGSRGTFAEVARRSGDFALVGAAVQATFDPDGRVSNLRAVCSGVAPVPFALDGELAAAIGSELDDPVLAEVDQAVRAALDPPSDVHASAAYRRVVAGTLVRRALAELRDEGRRG